MPVTARLSRAFYDAFGEQVVNELVELLNLVDSASRSDLQQLNDTNFARFEAKLEQRVSQLDAKIDGVAARTETLLANFTASMKDDMAKRFSEQMRFLYLGWALQFAAILGLWLR